MTLPASSAPVTVPFVRESLSDRLAREIRYMIQRGDYAAGDRLPTIMDLAKRFGVGHPTIREALKQLEAVGVVEIRHGSGVYVGRSEDVLVLAARDYGGAVTKKLLLDLIRARMALELQSVTDAARNVTAEQLTEMRQLLTTAGQNFANDELLSATNSHFHRVIGIASGNSVLAQLLGVVSELFVAEQRLILSIFGSRKRDHDEHLEILDALERRDPSLAAQRMRAHLQEVHDAVERWDPEAHPLG